MTGRGMAKKKGKRGTEPKPEARVEAAPPRKKATPREEPAAEPFDAAKPASSERAAEAADAPPRRVFRPLPAPLPPPSLPSEKSAIDNPVAIAIVMAIALAVLVGLTWNKGGGKAALLGPESAVPKASFLYAKVDVPTLRASPLFSAIVGEDGAGKSLGLDELSRGCGFDPLARVDDLVLAVPEGEAKGTFGLAAQVRVTESELATCAERIALARGTKTNPKIVGSFHVLEGEKGERGQPGLAFREGGLLVVAEGSWLGAMLAAAEGTEPRALGKDVHGELAAALVAEPSLAHPTVVVTALLPAPLRERLRGELGAEISSGGATGDDAPEAVMNAVLSVSAAGLAVSARAGEELSATAILRSETEVGARVLARLVERKRFAWSKDIGLRLVGLGAVVDSITAEPRGKEVYVRLHAPIDDLSRGIARAMSLGKRDDPRPERVAPAPPGSARRADEVLPAKRDGGS